MAAAHGIRTGLLVVVALLASATIAGSDLRGVVAAEEELEGRAPTPEELRPSVQAAFAHESYRPGEIATLAIFNRARGLTLQILHAGPEHSRTIGNNELHGVAVTHAKTVGDSTGHRVLRIRIGAWPSGLYFARLNSKDGRIGFAPFVLRPTRLGEQRVAVVLPTMTWQAYNLRDDDGDGKGDTWYADWSTHVARLGRPYLNRGVPYNFRSYDLPFLHWLAWTRKGVDHLADTDLDGARSARALADAYDLILFPGHHEYVTAREYELIRGYRDLGGNLAFLSANDFFWQVAKHANAIQRTAQWRDLGRPEAALIGVQYRGNDSGSHRGPWIVRDAKDAGWLFAGTGLTDGSEVGNGGIEIDKTTSASPRGVKVLAEIPNLFGPGFTAQMTYYQTPSGAKVFAAGAFTLAGSVLSNPQVGRMMENLWAHLATAA